MANVLARWESRGGAHYVDLEERRDYYAYTGSGCGGSLYRSVVTDAQAVAVMQAKVDTGYFLPDKAVVPMRRVV